MSIVTEEQIKEYREMWNPDQYDPNEGTVASMMHALCKHKSELTDAEIEDEILELALRVSIDP